MIAKYLQKSDNPCRNVAALKRQPVSTGHHSQALSISRHSDSLESYSQHSSCSPLMDLLPLSSPCCPGAGKGWGWAGEDTHNSGLVKHYTSVQVSFTCHSQRDAYIILYPNYHREDFNSRVSVEEVDLDLCASRSLTFLACIISCSILRTTSSGLLIN